MSRPLQILALAALAALGSACGGDDGPSDSGKTYSLLDHSKWTEVAHADDPFFAGRSDNPRCDANSFQIEGFTPMTQSIEIDTTACDYLTIGQPSPVAIRAGDTLHFITWHLRLSAPGVTDQNPIKGTVGIAIGDEIVWRIQPTIPGPENSFDQKLVAKSDAPAGAPLLFHVENHGSNSYNLMRLEVTRK